MLVIQRIFILFVADAALNAAYFGKKIIKQK
jgi:hypothetical protein